MRSKTSPELSTPEVLAAAARRADELLSRGSPRAALAVASRALKLGDDAALRLVRARALLTFRAEQAAERDLARCLALAPETVTALQLLCELALRRGDLAVAEIFLRDALAIDDHNLRSAELARTVRGWRAARTARGTPMPRSEAGPESEPSPPPFLPGRRRAA